jgi:hypothetical protein
MFIHVAKCFANEATSDPVQCERSSGQTIRDVTLARAFDRRLLFTLTDLESNFDESWWEFVRVQPVMNINGWTQIRFSSSFDQCRRVGRTSQLSLLFDSAFKLSSLIKLYVTMRIVYRQIYRIWLQVVYNHPYERYETELDDLISTQTRSPFSLSVKHVVMTEMKDVRKKNNTH